MKMGIDWSEFQPELLEIIANKLTIYIDYVRFRAVCVKWRSSVSPKPHHLPTQPPWLLFPYTSANGTDHCFLDPSTNKFHELNLVVSPDSRCCGSSQGWLVFVEECSPAIRLVNPLTRNVIHLPPLTTLPNVDFNISNLGNEYLIQRHCSPPSNCNMKNMRDYFIRKVVLSSSPNSLENDYIALLILYEIPGLAFHKKGVEEWSFIEEAGYDYYEDAIYYNGSFYAITDGNSIAICDISGVSPIVTLITVPYRPTNSITYLVDSFGELMLVTSNMEVGDSEDEYDSDYSVNETVHFSVFNYDSSKPEWVQMDTLGDHMLFLGGNSSVSLSASDFSGCERNCIYFSSDDKYLEKSHHNFGVYHLDDNSIVRFPYGHGSTRYFLPPPIWVTPNPC